MIRNLAFDYQPGEHEAEKASNSYLMSLVAVLGGLPLPIINLIATFFFFAANQNGTRFVRWHCVQALYSQVILMIVNGIGFWWTVSIVFSDKVISNEFIAYIIVVVLYNLVEFIATIYSAIQTRAGHHVEWWFFGDLTNLSVPKRESEPSIYN
jgi:uncharacterized membrane protein